MCENDTVYPLFALFPVSMHFFSQIYRATPSSWRRCVPSSSTLSPSRTFGIGWTTTSSERRETSSRVTKSEPTFRCSRCCVLCRLQNARSSGGAREVVSIVKKQKKKKRKIIEGKKEGKIFRHFFSPDRRKGLVIKSRLEDSFFLSSGNSLRDKERKETHLARRIKRREEKRKERETGRETRERERVFWEKKTKLRWIRKNKTAFKSFCGRSKRRTPS